MTTKIVKPGQLSPADLAALAASGTNVIVAGETGTGRTTQIVDVDLSDLRDIQCEDIAEVLLANVTTKIPLAADGT